MVVPLPEQTVAALAVAVPPTDAGLTVTVATPEVTAGHTPFATITR